MARPRRQNWQPPPPPKILRTDDSAFKDSRRACKLAEMEAQSIKPFRRELVTKIVELESAQITAEKLAQAKAEADAAIAEMEAELAAEEATC